MKFPTSHSSPSSLSSSSSSALTFDPAMCSSKSATAGCLSAILRRILCSGGLPTHPSDQIRELDSAASDKDQELKTKKKVEEAAAAAATVNASSNTPGIVARLMGLDSMVERETPSSSSASSLSRSRSMNSVDYLGESNSMQGLHRRVKSTLSFREVPPFIELENENFFILSFECVRESKEFRSKGKKTEMGSAGLKQKRVERLKMKENSRENVSREKILNENEKLRIRVCEKSQSPRNVAGNCKLREITNTVSQFKISSENKYFNSEAGKLSHSSKSIKNKEILKGERLKNRKKKKKKTSCSTEKKTELDCNLQESSPVSVLDFERKAHESADSCKLGFSSRRKLSAELENEQKSLLLSDGNLEKKKHGGSNSKRKENHNAQDYIEIWSEVLKIVEDDLVESKGIEAMVWKQGDSQSLSADFESEILDHLLDEFIDQIVGEPLKSL